MPTQKTSVDMELTQEPPGGYLGVVCHPQHLNLDSLHVDLPSTVSKCVPLSVPPVTQLTWSSAGSKCTRGKGKLFRQSPCGHNSYSDYSVESDGNSLEGMTLHEMCLEKMKQGGQGESKMREKLKQSIEKNLKCRRKICWTRQYHEANRKKGQNVEQCHGIKENKREKMSINKVKRTENVKKGELLHTASDSSVVSSAFVLPVSTYPYSNNTFLGSRRSAAAGSTACATRDRPEQDLKPIGSLDPVDLSLKCEPGSSNVDQDPVSVSDTCSSPIILGPDSLMAVPVELQVKSEEGSLLTTGVAEPVPNEHVEMDEDFIKELAGKIAQSVLRANRNITGLLKFESNVSEVQDFVMKETTSSRGYVGTDSSPAFNRLEWHSAECMEMTAARPQNLKVKSELGVSTIVPDELHTPASAGPIHSSFSSVTKVDKCEEHHPKTTSRNLHVPSFSTDFTINSVANRPKVISTATVPSVCSETLIVTPQPSQSDCTPTNMATRTDPNQQNLFSDHIFLPVPLDLSLKVEPPTVTTPPYKSGPAVSRDSFMTDQPHGSSVYDHTSLPCPLDLSMKVEPSGNKFETDDSFEEQDYWAQHGIDLAVALPRTNCTGADLNDHLNNTTLTQDSMCASLLKEEAVSAYRSPVSCFGEDLDSCLSIPPCFHHDRRTSDLTKNTFESGSPFHRHTCTCTSQNCEELRGMYNLAGGVTYHGKGIDQQSNCEVPATQTSTVDLSKVVKTEPLSPRPEDKNIVQRQSCSAEFLARILTDSIFGISNFHDGHYDPSCALCCDQGARVSSPETETSGGQRDENLEKHFENVTSVGTRLADGMVISRESEQSFQDKGRENISVTLPSHTHPQRGRDRIETGCDNSVPPSHQSWSKHNDHAAREENKPRHMGTLAIPPAHQTVKSQLSHSPMIQGSADDAGEGECYSTSVDAIATPASGKSASLLGTSLRPARCTESKSAPAKYTVVTKLAHIQGEHSNCNASKTAPNLVYTVPFTGQLQSGSVPREHGHHQASTSMSASHCTAPPIQPAQSAYIHREHSYCAESLVSRPFVSMCGNASCLSKPSPMPTIFASKPDIATFRGGHASLAQYPLQHYSLPNQPLFPVNTSATLSLVSTDPMPSTGYPYRLFPLPPSLSSPGFYNSKPKEEPPSAPTQSNSEVKKSSKTAKTPPKVVKKSPVASSPVKSEPPSPAKTRSSQLLPVVPLKRIHQEHVTRTCRSASAGGHAVRAMASNQPRRLVLGKDKQKNAKGRKREKTQAVEMNATPSPKKRKEMEGVILSTKQKVSSHVKTEASRKLVQKAKGSKPKSPVKTKTVSKVQKVGCKVKKDATKRKPAPFVPKKSKRLIAQASKSGVYVELSQSDIDMIAVVSDKDDQLEKSLPKPKPAVPKPRDKSPEKSKPDNSVSRKSVAEEACTTPKVPKKCSSNPSSGPKQKAAVKKTAKPPSDTNNPRDMRPKLLKMKTRASPQIIKQATKTTASTSKQPTIQLAPTIPFPSPDGVARMEGIPVYHPSPEQFQDPISYITSVRNDAEHYGMCRIVPPDGWQPECKIPDDLRFTTQIQYINKLKTRWGPNSIKMECIRRHLEGLGIRLEQPPLFGGVELDLPGLYDTIQKFGGMQKVIDKKKWLKVADTLGVPKQAQDRRTKLYEAYCKYLLSYDTLSKEEKDKLEQQVLADRAKKNKPQPDCMAKGKSRTLSEYYRIARNTMSMRFKDDPSSDQVETEFWGIVGDSKSHVAVQAGHVDTKHCGSGFPTKKESPYSRHGWNFHMLQNNSGSLLKHIGLVSGVTVPAVHIGMLFSVSAWSQDPHLLPYIQYMHTGSDKVWYCVPRNQEEKLKTALQELVPGLMSNSACWLKPDTVMVSPQDLLSKGVSIGRTVLSQGQFVVVFPACTTATISCGYNLCESLRFATTDWLPLGCKAARMLQSSGEMELFSTERLLFKLARHEKTSTEVLRKLLPELEQIVEKELSERKQLSDLGLKASEKMNVDDQVSPTGKRKRIHDPSEDEDNRCEVCNKMCYLSMVRNDGEDCVYSLGHAIPHIQKKRNLKLCRLIYRHEEKELKEIVNRVKERLESHTTPNKKRVLKGKAKADS